MPSTEITEPFRMIEAPSLRCGSAACTVKNTAVMLVLDDLLKDLARGGTKRRAARDAGIGEHDVEFAEFRRPPASIAASVAAMSVASATIASAFGPSSFAAASSVCLDCALLWRPCAPSATNSLAVASPMPLLPPVINAVLFASLMAVSDGCIIKPDCLPRASGLMLQPHKAVIGLESDRRLPW